MSNIISTISESPLLTSIVSESTTVRASTFSEGGRMLSELTDIDLQGVTDGSILVYDTNEFVARTLSGDASINSDGVLTINPNSVTLGADTSGAYVSTITGTTDQITVLGSGGETANVTLSLPQSLATSSSPTFNNITLSGVINNADLDARLESKTQDWLNIINRPTTLSGYGITDAASSTALSNHVSDASVHLTSTQNMLLDTLTSLPTPSTIALRDDGGRLHATQLRLHGENFYSQLNFAPNPTQNLSFDFPNISGALATTAFVNNKASDINPLMNGTVAIGTSTQYAREDHVHPIDTSRAPLASPSFTGTPIAPTPPSTSNDTSIATTSFVTSKLGGVVDLTSNQTIAGTKTFTGQLVLNFSQNQLVLKNGLESNAMLITVPAALTANRTITIPDVGFSGAVVLNVGPQNISGVKTFTTSPVVPTPTTSGQAASKGYVDGVVLGNHTHTASAISDSTSAGRTILTATDHPAQITALSNITSIGSTTINLTAADSGKIFRCTSSNAVTINMPSTDPGSNFTVAVMRSGTGTVTFAANGKTLNSYNNLLTIAGQHAWASVIREAVDVYNLAGTLSL